MTNYKKRTILLFTATIILSIINIIILLTK